MFPLFKKIYLFIFVLDLPDCAGFSLVAEIGGYSVAVVLGVLVVEASFVLEHGLKGGSPWASLLHGTWDLPRPRTESVSPALAGRFFTATPSGKPCFLLKGRWCLTFIMADQFCLTHVLGEWDDVVCALLHPASYSSCL